MSTNKPPLTKETVLILADISGYTKFMVKNRGSEIHSQLVIGKIIQAIIDTIQLPLKVAKLEGDAIFLYAVKNEREEAWRKDRERIGAHLIEFFTTFADELVKLSGSKLCYGDSCEGLEKLRLKIVIHTGDIIFQKIGDYDELGGVDVITAHLLLKNTIKSDEYIFLTDRAYRDVKFPHDLEVAKHSENYSDVGAVHGYVYVPASIRQKG